MTLAYRDRLRNGFIAGFKNKSNDPRALHVYKRRCKVGGSTTLCSKQLLWQSFDMTGCIHVMAKANSVQQHYMLPGGKETTPCCAHLSLPACRISLATACEENSCKCSAQVTRDGVDASPC